MRGRGERCIPPYLAVCHALLHREDEEVVEKHPCEPEREEEENGAHSGPIVSILQFVLCQARVPSDSTLIIYKYLTSSKINK